MSLPTPSRSILIVAIFLVLSSLLTKTHGRVGAQVKGVRVETLTSPARAEEQRLSLSNPPGRKNQLELDLKENTFTLNAVSAASLPPSDPRQVGILRSSRLSSESIASRLRLSDGRILKTFAIKSPGAVSIRVHFENINLGPDDELYVYGVNPDTHISGPYVAAGPFGDGKFWSDTIDGDTVVVEAAVGSDSTAIGVKEILHNYRSLSFQDLQPSVLSCHNDASCFNDPERSAIARILYIDGGGFVCTGQLMNNIAGDLAPYFLTAAHCVNDRTVARTVEAFWFYRTTACNSGVLGTWVRTPAGASLLNTQTSTDSSLLRLLRPLPGGVSFSGWIAAQQTLSTNVFGLHHPGGSLPPSLNSHLRRSSGVITSLNSACPPSGLLNGYIADWTSGLTEPGSSGSGLWVTVDGNNYLVGLLSCGPTQPSCADLSLYTRFSDFYPLIQTYADLGDSGGVCAAVPINVGQTVTGFLDSADCRSRVQGFDWRGDYYSFSGVAGQQIAISMYSFAGGQFVDTYVNLIGPDKSVVAENDTNGGSSNARIPAGGGLFTLPATGTYIIEATSSAPDTGTYFLQLTDSAAPRTLTIASTNPGSGAPIAVSPADLNSSSDGVTPFTRSYTHSTQVMLAAPTTIGANTFNKWMRNGADYSTSGSVAVVMNEAQTLTAVYSGPSGSCQLTSIGLGTSLSAELAVGDCASPIKGASFLADRYSFNGLAGERIAIQAASANVDCFAYLLNPSGSIIAQDDDGGPGNSARIPASSGFFTLPLTGTYTIEVTSSSAASSGSYSLDLLAFDSDRDGIPDDVEVTQGTNRLVKDNDIFNNATLFAKQQYRDFLGREGDAGGVSFWANQITSGGQSRAQVIQSFFNSGEFQNTTAPVTRLYFAYFLRIPDTGGLFFWVNAFKSGTPLDSISAAFAGSAEFQTRYGSLNNTEFVTLVYNNVLARPPDAAGLSFWVGQLDSGALTRGQVMLGFSESTEYRNSIFNEVFVTQIYVGMLRRAPDVGGFNFWVSALDNGTSGLNLIQSFLGSPEYRQRFLP